MSISDKSELDKFLEALDTRHSRRGRWSDRIGGFLFIISIGLQNPKILLLTVDTILWLSYKVSSMSLLELYIIVPVV